MSHWLRREVVEGTLDTLLLTRTPLPLLAAGVALALLAYTALSFIGAMGVGALLFQITFQRNHLPLALIFLLIGLLPLYGLALLYSGLTLWLQETSALLQLAQSLAALLMGVYLPLSVMPAALRVASILFPPTWLLQGLRGSLLGWPYLSGSPWFDLGILLGFGVISIAGGLWWLAHLERGWRAGWGGRA
jgi:ABC-type multidrug transport system permease subunit